MTHNVDDNNNDVHDDDDNERIVCAFSTFSARIIICYEGHCACVCVRLERVVIGFIITIVVVIIIIILLVTIVSRVVSLQ